MAQKPITPPKGEEAPNYTASVETGKVNLDVYQCKCGMHIGLDASYLEQVGGIAITCPNCKTPLYVEGY